MHMYNRNTYVNPSDKGRMGTVFSKLMKYAGSLKTPVLVALILAALGAVLTIIGPSQLSKITDYISEALYGSIDMGLLQSLASF